MRITYAVAVVLIVMFSMGAQCSSNQAEEYVESPWRGGIEGLYAKFEEINSVSDTGTANEVWEDESFPVEVYLNNRGEYTIPANTVELEIKGISPSDFSGLDFTKTNSEELEKVSQFLPDGGESWVDFGKAKYQNLVGTHYDASIFLYMTYPYETYINIPKVCYKENIKDTTVCDVDSTKQAFASGGPVQVGTVQQRYIGKGKILLEIPVRNVDKGRMVAYKNDEFKEQYDEFAFQAEDPEWGCTARGNPNVGRIYHPTGQPGNEEVVIRCVNDNLEKGALFTKSVTLTLKYYYRDWVEERVRIRENPE